jgi:cytochrome bd ubiquinol oxidase subunit II
MARRKLQAPGRWGCHMVEIWYAILSLMLMMFVVLEGFDIGVGMLQQVVGKTQQERRLVIAAIGPLWTWNEVCLLSFGGTLMLVFPNILAVSFAGFYLALFLLLWSLLLRGVSIEFGGHIADPLWQTGWDFIFGVSNVLLAILIGAALGNVLRGVPLDAHGKFALTFFTNFSPRGNVGILDWYTVSVAVFVTITFMAHGANALVMKTEGPVHDRSLQVSRMLWKIVPVLLAIITTETWQVRPDLFFGILHQPFGWLGGVCVVAGLINVLLGLKSGQEFRAVVGSIAFVSGLMIAGAAGVFPVMLYSTLGPEYSLSAYQNVATGYGLSIALVWWPIALILSMTYFIVIYRHYTGKVKLDKSSY